MLSKIDIERKVEEGEMEVEPWEPSNLKPASLPVHLNNEIAVAKEGEIDPLQKEDYEENFERKELSKGETHTLYPGEFILGRTIEKLKLPKDMAALLDGKTTLARLGVSVTQGAMLIHPGSGDPEPRKIVLEIKNNGPFKVKLTNEMRIGELYFHETNTPSDIGYDEKWDYGNRDDLNDLFPVPEIF